MNRFFLILLLVLNSLLSQDMSPSYIASFGSVTMNNKVYNQISFTPEIPISQKIGLGLEFYLYFDENGELYGKNWDFSTSESNYSNLISAKVHSEKEVLMEGSVFDDNLPRLVNIFGNKMEVNPSGTLLFIQNEDVPGVIGKVGTLLGDKKINIAAYLLSREKNKNLAFAVIRLDDTIDSPIIDMLCSINELKFVRQINLKDY